MGAQLRRADEVNLWEDVKETVTMWKKFLENSPLILMSCPKTMQKGLFTATDNMWTDKMRKIPLNVGRPTYETVCAVHEIMMQATLREFIIAKDDAVVEPVVVAPPNETIKEKEVPVRIKEFPPLTLLHELAAEGNVEAIEKLLETDSTACAELMDLHAGHDLMTALHYAAAFSVQDPNASAAIVSLLLIQGKANPCLVDGWNRVPYFLASHKKTREAFRWARADLGEECGWSWDEEAKVGQALLTEDMERKQEKMADKKRRQRARQKEKKAREKAQAQKMAEQAKEQQEEERNRQEDSKQIQDGLAPKTTSAATNFCDFCQKTYKGKRRSQMLQIFGDVTCRWSRQKPWCPGRRCVV
jgi:Bacteroidetes VLRF1 release factor/Ankyrin repeat